MQFGPTATGNAKTERQRGQKQWRRRRDGSWSIVDRRIKPVPHDQTRSDVQRSSFRRPVHSCREMWIGLYASGCQTERLERVLFKFERGFLIAA